MAARLRCRAAHVFVRALGADGVLGRRGSERPTQLRQAHASEAVSGGTRVSRVVSGVAPETGQTDGASPFVEFMPPHTSSHRRWGETPQRTRQRRVPPGITAIRRGGSSHGWHPRLAGCFGRPARNRAELDVRQSRRWLSCSARTPGRRRRCLGGTPKRTRQRRVPPRITAIRRGRSGWCWADCR